MLNKLLLMLNLSDETANTALLTALLEASTNKVLIHTNSTTLPPSLEWIVIELAIKRFNRLGSEGVASESVEGISKTYEGEADELAAYMNYINAAIATDAATSKFRFI